MGQRHSYQMIFQPVSGIDDGNTSFKHGLTSFYLDKNAWIPQRLLSRYNTIS